MDILVAQAGIGKHAGSDMSLSNEPKPFFIAGYFQPQRFAQMRGLGIELRDISGCVRRQLRKPVRMGIQAMAIEADPLAIEEASASDCVPCCTGRTALASRCDADGPASNDHEPQEREARPEPGRSFSLTFP